MNKRKVIALLIALLCSPLMIGVVHAMSSSNYAIEWDVIGGGGGETHSASYAMQSIIGDTAIETASENYRLGAGYWYCVTDGEPETCGDVNGDGEITTTDAVITLEIAAGSRPFNSAADVDGDGVVTSLDVLMILQAAVGAIEIL